MVSTNALSADVTSQFSANAALAEATSPTANIIPLRPRTNTPQQPTLTTRQTDRLQADQAQAIRTLQGQIFSLKQQLSQANNQAHYAQVYAAKQHTSNSTMNNLPSTYIVPKRLRNHRFDKLTQSIPFFVLLTLSIGAFSVAIATSIPSLWPSVQVFLAALARSLFLIIACSTLGSFVLEICFNRSR
ncbi:MAG: hypothetical protein AAFP09_15190 [Cyanobacteria bacterium J06607_10]